MPKRKAPPAEIPAAEVPETPVSTPLAASSAAVMLDDRGIGYLRVETTAKGGARLILNTGKAVELVEMDARTLKSRGLKVASEVDVYETAKFLFTPPTSSTIVSERCKSHLNRILNDKEINMASETKKAKSAKKAPKVSAAKANGRAKGASHRNLSPDMLLKFKKGPTEDSIKRHVDILATLKEDGGGSMTLAEFSKAFGKRVKTKQEPAKIFGRYRKALVDGGFISVTEPTA